MRVALLALLALASVAFVAAQGAPPTPIPAQNKGDMGMCQLDALDFHAPSGLSIMGRFSPTKFEYECSCLDWSKIGTGEAAPKIELDLIDNGSTAQVWFNGKAINTKTLGNALTGTGMKTSNPLATNDNPFKVGKNLVQIRVNCHVDPASGEQQCNYIYEIVCTRPPTGGGSVVGDPQFVGLRGQNYQVHGVSGEIYNIVSDSDVQYNSRFVFLNAGSCPVVNGRKQKGCFSHPGSYLGELGLKTRAGDRIHLVTGSAKLGFASVTVNDKEVAMGETVILADNLGSVSRNNTHLASVQVGNWDFSFENSDMYVNQKVRVLDSRNLRSHGLLGQTWRESTYNNAVKYIAGTVDDYVIREGGIFGDSFLYNAHN